MQGYKTGKKSNRLSKKNCLYRSYSTLIFYLYLLILHLFNRLSKKICLYRSYTTLIFYLYLLILHLYSSYTSLYSKRLIDCHIVIYVYAYTVLYKSYILLILHLYQKLSKNIPLILSYTSLIFCFYSAYTALIHQNCQEILTSFTTLPP